MNQEKILSLAKEIWSNDEEVALELANVIFGIRDGDYDEPKFKVGNWMINTKTESSFGKESSNPLLVTKDWLEHVEKYGKTYGGNTPYTGDLNNFILWHPKDDEWCVFYNNKNVYTVDRFYFYNCEEMMYYSCNEEEAYKYIAPLEFIQTLKDK